jgi:hypothetical protein
MYKHDAAAKHASRQPDAINATKQNRKLITAHGKD